MVSQGITILGSTGSIGESTLKVISLHPDRYHVVALSAHQNVTRLAQQCKQYQARYAVISNSALAADLQTALVELGCNSEVLAGEDSLSVVSSLDETDAVMAAIVGAAGLKPTLCAAQHGKRLLLANKESMVIAGELFRRYAAENNATIIPVDSEHNALFQALPENFASGLEKTGVERLILTASGGPFLHTKQEDLVNMERNMRKMGSRLLGLYGRNPADWDNLMAEPGSGAAGGIGFALRHALPDSSFVEGFQLVSEILNLSEGVSKADCILTGEGRFDKSSLAGKGPFSLLVLTGQEKPVKFFCGSADPQTVNQLSSIYPNLKVLEISDPGWPLDKSLRETPNTLKIAVLDSNKAS